MPSAGGGVIGVFVGVGLAIELVRGFVGGLGGLVGESKDIYLL